MKIYVVRHGTTQFNERKIFCGRMDLPLSEAGRREIPCLQERLQGCEYDAIFTSPLLRARETAEGILTEKEVPMSVDSRLAERNFGDLEGTPMDGEAARASWTNFAVKCPNGESYLQTAARVYGFLNELKGLPYRGVVIVTHGIVCRLIRTYFCGMTDPQFYAFMHENGAVEEYEL